MSKKKMITPLILAGFMLNLAVGLGTAAPAGLSAQQQPAQAPANIPIPKEVKKAMEEGLATRQSVKNDIPFTISESLYMPLPGQSVSFHYLLLKVKNADMGYAVPPAPQGIDPTAPVTPSKLVAHMYAFVQYYQVVDGKPGALLKETYAPANFESDPAGYDPEAIDWYSFGYPLPAGNYLAAVSLATPNSTTFGVQYFEFSLPDQKSVTDRLETGSILFLKDLQQVQTPETQATLHRGELALSIYRLLPNLEKTYAVGNSLDLFFFIMGAKPDASGKYDLQVQFEVDKLLNESDIDSSKSPLVIKNWNWERTAGNEYIEVKGEVKNISKENLNNIEVLATSYDKDNKYISHSSALLEYNPIVSLQTSPFKVLQKNNPLIENVIIEFKYLNGEKINATTILEPAIKFQAGKFNSPVIEQPLPLKQTLEVITGDKKETKVQDLPVGSYVLVIRLQDVTSGLKAEKKIDFIVK